MQTDSLPDEPQGKPLLNLYLQMLFINKKFKFFFVKRSKVAEEIHFFVAKSYFFYYFLIGG